MHKIGTKKAVPFLLLGLASLATPTFASWQVTYQANGSDQYGPNSQNGTIDWDNFVRNGGNFAWDPVEFNFGNDVFINSTGKVSSPGSGNQNPANKPRPNT